MSDNSYSGHPIMQERPDLKAETQEVRQTEIANISSLQHAREVYERSQGDQTATDLSDAINQTLQHLNGNSGNEDK